MSSETRVRLADRPAIAWPTGLACMGGGFCLIWPYLRGVLVALGLRAATEPAIRQPVFISMAVGLGLLLFSLPGWWRTESDRAIARLAVIVLAIGFGMWLLDVADILGGGVLPFLLPSALYAACVGIGSVLLAVGFWRTRWFPRSGLVLLGGGGLLGMALLSSPWPLGLGPIVPAVVVAYAIGWIRVGLAARIAQPAARTQTAREVFGAALDIAQR